MFTQELYKKLCQEDNVEFDRKEWGLISSFLSELQRKMKYNCWGLGDCLYYELSEWEKELVEYEGIDTERAKVMSSEAVYFAEQLAEVNIL